MPVRDDTFSTRRHLPHLQKPGKSYYVTFSTGERYPLSPLAKTVALECCFHDHGVTYCLECAVIMPDHVHMIFTPYESWTLPKIMKRVKGNSSRLINRALERRGTLWESESFDRIIRTRREDVRKKAEYICQNPVTDGLVSNVEDYPWLWRLWVEGGQTGLSVLHRSSSSSSSR